MTRQEAELVLTEVRLMVAQLIILTLTNGLNTHEAGVKIGTDFKNFIISLVEPSE